MEKRDIVRIGILKLKSLADNGDVRLKEFMNYGTHLPNSMAISLNIDGEAISGYGQGRSKDIASFKALMEVVERYIFMKSSASYFLQGGKILPRRKTREEIDASFPNSKIFDNSSTNGFAIHTSRKSAKENAVSELIERHVLLKSMALGLSPKKVEFPKIINVGQYLVPKNIDCDFYSWQGPLEHYIVCVRVRKQEKICYGFGCSTSLEKAKEKAFFEVTPRIHLLKQHKVVEKYIDQTNQHFSFHWSTEAKWTNDFFAKAQASESVKVDPHLSKKDFWVGEVSIPEPFKILNLCAFQAISPFVQPLFSGEWRAEKINPLAISSFENLPPERHIVG